ncbi:hypothetical protein GWO43_19665 [candidate division KSB1 bacterium]|nr:hypothetical protein [candidate division KSB1 bacterium]NIX72732.1 hypothetical protein [candidate division KSB1 bacterium]
MLNPKLPFLCDWLTENSILYVIAPLLSEAISLLGTAGDCFGKKRLAMTPRLRDFRSAL